MAPLPDQLTAARHRDLDGRDKQVLARRIFVVACTALIAAALLGAIGQPDQLGVAATPAATLRVIGPGTLRGGLLWRDRIEIRARRAIALPRLVLGAGYVDGMQLNSVEPQAQSEAGRDGRIVLSYAALDAGKRLVVRLQAQVDPTTLGREDLGVELDDRARPLARLTRTVTVLP